MSSLQVSPAAISGTQSSPAALSPEGAEARAKLFAGELSTEPIAIDAGPQARIALPAFEPASAPLVSEAFQKLDAADRQKLVELGRQNYAAVVQHAGQMEGGSVSDEPFMAEYQDAVQELTGTGERDALLLGLQLNVESGKQDMTDIGMELQNAVAQRREVQTQLRELTDIIREEDLPTEFEYYDENGELQTVTLETQDQAKDLKAELDRTYQSMGTLTEMKTQELQQALQNYNIAFQSLSAAIKSMHDTDKAVIGNWRV